MVTTVNPLLCHSYYSTACDGADACRGCATTVGRFDSIDATASGRRRSAAGCGARHVIATATAPFLCNNVPVARSAAHFVSKRVHRTHAAALYNRAACETDNNSGETKTVASRGIWQPITSFTERKEAQHPHRRVTRHRTRPARHRRPRLHHIFSRHHHRVSARGAQNGCLAAGNEP